MSRNNNSWLGTAGNVATGVGLIAGLGFLAYEFYEAIQKEEQQKQQEQREQRQYNELLTTQRQYNELTTQRQLNNSSKRYPNRPTGCGLCKKNDDSQWFELKCSHKFHSSCLTANYILKKGENPIAHYKCPTCKIEVSKEDIRGFTKNFQS